MCVSACIWRPDNLVVTFLATLHSQAGSRAVVEKLNWWRASVLLLTRLLHRQRQPCLHRHRRGQGENPLVSAVTSAAPRSPKQQRLLSQR